mmetsp:Transcript_11684/g.17963  ORF Transcript_11684/g.17963 Transcript_11684/m.17963 type:complete len:304 (-) Transcript_11684:365-1276(-)
MTALQPAHRISNPAAAAAAALIGAITSDAAAQTSHWNYQRDAFHNVLGDAGRMDNPEFFSLNPFYSVPVGGQSCYGDQIIEIARHLSSCTQKNDEANTIDLALTSPDCLNDLVNRFETSFGPESAYGPWPVDSEYKPKKPINGPWRHASIKGFLTNLSLGKRRIPECGSDDSQADSIAKSIPVVCAYAGSSELLDRVETVVRLTQNSDEAVEYAQVAALVVEACIMGTDYQNDKSTSTNFIINALTSALQDERVNFDLEAQYMMRLVIKILQRGPSSFEEAVDLLSQEPIMKPLLKSPVSLVS